MSSGSILRLNVLFAVLLVVEVAFHETFEVAAGGVIIVRVRGAAEPSRGALKKRSWLAGSFGCWTKS